MKITTLSVILLSSVGVIAAPYEVALSVTSPTHINIGGVDYTTPIYCDWVNVLGAPSIVTPVQADMSETNSLSLSFVKNKPVRVATAGSTRTLNSSFQISTTNDVIVNYSIDVNATASLAGGQDGVVFLETSPNNSTWTTIDQGHNQNSVSLAIALTTVQNVTIHLGGMIPPAYWVRIRTSQATGTPSFAFRFGNETLF